MVELGMFVASIVVLVVALQPTFDRVMNFLKNLVTKALIKQAPFGAHNKERKMNELITKLLKVGKLWEAGSNKRIYLNDEFLDSVLELTRYKTGAISSAKFLGEKISNSKAMKLIPRKMWYDLVQDKFFADTADTTAFAAAIAKIKSPY